MAGEKSLVMNMEEVKSKDINEEVSYVVVEVDWLISLSLQSVFL